MAATCKIVTRLGNAPGVFQEGLVRFGVGFVLDFCSASNHNSNPCAGYCGLLGLSVCTISNGSKAPPSRMRLVRGPEVADGAFHRYLQARMILYEVQPSSLTLKPATISLAGNIKLRYSGGLIATTLQQRQSPLIYDFNLITTLLHHWHSMPRTQTTTISSSGLLSSRLIKLHGKETCFPAR